MDIVSISLLAILAAVVMGFTIVGIWLHTCPPKMKPPEDVDSERSSVTV